MQKIVLTRLFCKIVSNSGFYPVFSVIHGFDHNNPGSVFDNSDNIRDAFQPTVYGNPFDRFCNPDQRLFYFVSICFFWHAGSFPVAVILIFYARISRNHSSAIGAFNHWLHGIFYHKDKNVYLDYCRRIISEKKVKKIKIGRR